MTRIHVLHETRYRYAGRVALSQHLLHLAPRTFQFQRCEAHAITVTPAPAEDVPGIDYFGNLTRHVAITLPHDTLAVRAESTVRLEPRPTDVLIERSLRWEDVREDLRQIGAPALSDPLKYLSPSPHVSPSEELAAYARVSFTPGRSVLEAALDLMQRINGDFAFVAGITTVSTSLAELMRLRRGVCQDFAHLMIGGLRSLGLACRYMSGYILTTPAPGKPRLTGADASHAWVSVYCPSIGWVDFDPTNRCMVDQDHVTLGWGRDFSDVSLLRGVTLGGGAQTLEVEVTATPLPEAVDAR